MYGGERPSDRLSVIAAPHQAPELDALQATLAGARAELSAAGVLAPGDSYPRLVVELVRVDERSSGIAALDDEGAGEIPLARGAAVGVTARGWVEPQPGRPRMRDTGDLRRVEYLPAQNDPGIDAMRYSRAVRAAARRVGRAVARRSLGEPEQASEPL